MADAGHMANDSLSIFLAWIGLFLSLKWQKWLALINGISLVWVAIWIFIEAVTRWQAPIEIAALPMLGVALLGFGINLLVAFIMLKSNRHNLNIRAAYLHVLVDLFGSVVAIIAGISAWWLNWQWVDVVASGILSILYYKAVFLQFFKLLNPYIVAMTIHCRMIILIKVKNCLRK